MPIRSAQTVHAQDADETFLRDFDLLDMDADPPTFWTRMWWGRARRVIEWVTAGTRPGGVVVDVGCSSGGVTIALAEAGFRCIGIDLNPSYLRWAARKEDASQVWWVTANALELPLADASCDALILGEILEHVAEPTILLREALRVVKPDGIMIATTPNGAGFRDRSLPSYAEASRDLDDLRARQFGPAGQDHLFALRPDELRAMTPDGTTVELSFAGSGLWSRPLSLPARSRVVSDGIEALSRSGPWAPRLCTTLLAVYRRAPAL